MWYCLWRSTEFIIGIVWQYRSCNLHIWHCLTMPIVHSQLCITFRKAQNSKLAKSNNANCTLNVVLPVAKHRIHNWHCLTIPIVQAAYMALSDNANWAPSTWYYLSQSTEFIIGIVQHGQLYMLHRWHCLTMPIVHVLYYPWGNKYYIFGIVWQCQICIVSVLLILATDC